MVNITLEYQPFRFLKYKRKINGTFPSAFDELKPEQLIAVAGLVNQTISETGFLHLMTDIKKYRIHKLDDYLRYQLMVLFEPFTEIKPHDRFIIQEISTWQTVLVCPKPKLHGVSFGQFIFAESYFSSYQANKKPEDLHKFVASLYLPELHAFNEDKIPAIALTVAKIKPEILDAIVINYILIKEWLALAYPLVFQKENEYDENYEPQKKSLKKPVNNSGWIKIFESIVGDDLVNEDKYAILPLNNVLRWMTTKIKESMKRK